MNVGIRLEAGESRPMRDEVTAICRIHDPRATRAVYRSLRGRHVGLTIAFACQAFQQLAVSVRLRPGRHPSRSAGRPPLEAEPERERVPGESLTVVTKIHDPTRHRVGLSGQGVTIRVSARSVARARRY